MLYNIEQIKAIIPHRYPFLLIDQVDEIEADGTIVARKAVSINEPFFQGHFPGYPVMPGVLIMEALAQVGAVAILSMEENRGKIGLFAGIDGARFRQQVKPGDVLRLEIEMTKIRGSIGKANGKASVAGKTVAEAELTFALAAPEADKG